MLTIALLISIFAMAQETRQLAVDKPSAIADLKTAEGAALVNAKWYVQPAHIVETSFKSPGPSSKDPLLLYPTGMMISTHTRPNYLFLHVLLNNT